jgi:hypothetical protein
MNNTASNIHQIDYLEVIVYADDNKKNNNRYGDFTFQNCNGESWIELRRNESDLFSKTNLYRKLCPKTLCICLFRNEFSMVLQRKL